jgi:hypothetical protein
MLVSCLAYSLILKTEVTCSSETLVHFQWTTWHYIAEDRTLVSLLFNGELDGGPCDAVLPGGGGDV